MKFYGTASMHSLNGVNPFGRALRLRIAIDPISWRKGQLADHANS